MRVNYKNTPEKYQTLAEIIIPPLLDLLKSLTLLEEEIFERNRALDKEKEALGIPSNQLHPLWNELMDETNATYNWTSDSKILETRSSKFLWLPK